MKSLGKFTAYTPTKKAMPDLMEGINYLKSDTGIDWYSISWDKTRTGKNVYVLADDNGDVVCASDQGELLFPQGFTVYELPKEETPDNLLGKLYWKVVDGELVPPNIEYLNGTTLKSQRQREAESAIRLLERAVKYNMATDEEKAQLEAWERYSVLLSRVDTDKAPDIEWPVKPENQLPQEGS